MILQELFDVSGNTNITGNDAATGATSITGDLTLAGAKTVQSEVRGRSRHVDSQAVVHLCIYAIMVPSRFARKSLACKQLCSYAFMHLWSPVALLASH